MLLKKIQRGWVSKSTPTKTMLLTVFPLLSSSKLANTQLRNLSLEMTLPAAPQLDEWFLPIQA